MIKSYPYHWLECDSCSTRCDYDGEITAWMDRADAVSEAEEFGWSTDGKRHHCPSCKTLFRCEECQGPASDPADPDDLCGERDYLCKPCFAKAQEDAVTADEIYAG